jgi:hypothetical protein
MSLLSYGTYRGVSWYRHAWGLELSAIDNDGIYRKYRYMGNGSDRVSIVESAAHFVEIYPSVELEQQLATR